MVLPIYCRLPYNKDVASSHQASGLVIAGSNLASTLPTGIPFYLAWLQ
jgi:hypothetical protein